MIPKELVKKWIIAFNSKDLDSLGRLYAVDAINHQVVTSPLKGRDQIIQMFKEEFARTEMVCIEENIFEDGDWAILEWRDPLGLRGCGFFKVINSEIVFQRGYWDTLSFLRQHGLPLPKE